MTTKIVLINAPAGAGKDEAAKHIQTNSVKTKHMEFKECLFSLVKLVYNISDKDWDTMYTRENKELPHDVLNGLSPRQALIHMSEDVIKPSFGKNFFGDWIRKQINQYEGYGFVRFIFSDSGFPEEAQALVDAFGAENVTVIRVFRDGCSYEGDSRSYLEPEMLSSGVSWIDVDNDSSLEDYLSRMLTLFKKSVGTF